MLQFLCWSHCWKPWGSSFNVIVKMISLGNPSCAPLEHLLYSTPYSYRHRSSVCLCSAKPGILPRILILGRSFKLQFVWISQTFKYLYLQLTVPYRWKGCDYLKQNKKSPQKTLNQIFQVNVQSLQEQKKQQHKETMSRWGIFSLSKNIKKSSVIHETYLSTALLFSLSRQNRARTQIICMDGNKAFCWREDDLQLNF